MNILSLFPKHLYDTKMSPGRTLYLNHVGKSHKVVWSGVGWNNWDELVPADFNIRSIESEHEIIFDAIIVYKGNGLIEMQNVDRLKIVIFNEAHDHNAVSRELQSCNADYAVFHHESDLRKWKGSQALACWPHAAPEVPLVPWEERRWMSISSGCTSQKIYPVRVMAAAAAKEAFGDEHYELQHPGYRLPNRRAVLEQYLSYLKTLSQAKISICCTSIHKYPLAKLIESAMCGCVVVTDKPICSEFEEHLWLHCVQIPKGVTQGYVKDRLLSYDDDELKEMGLAARKAAMEHFSYDHWSDCLISAIEDYR
jgi:hypothetical protein